MAKLSFEDWVMTYKTEAVNADRARGATFLAVTTGSFIANPLLGIIAGPSLFAAHYVMTEDFKKSLKRQYEEYLQS